MKTVDDIWGKVGLPCCRCKYLFSNICASVCVNTTLNYMYMIAEDMILRGEY